MNDVAAADPDIAGLLVDVICDALPAAVIVYDSNDHLIHVGGQIQLLPPFAEELLTPGSRVRDILSAIFDRLDDAAMERMRARGLVTKEIWVAEQISSLWRERSEQVERRGDDRWIQYLKRRLPSGYGVCIIRDISEQKKRDDQRQLDNERVRAAENVLNALPFPICVKAENLVYVTANPAFCRLVGRSQQDILGLTPADVFAAPVASRLETTGRQILKNDISIMSPERFIKPDGTELDSVVYKFRVGEPGRHQVVTAMEYSASPPRAHAARGDTGETLTCVDRGLVLQEIGGRNVLVVTTDCASAASAAETLSSLGANTSALSDVEELRLFLTIAAEESVRLDLILADDGFAQICCELGREYQIPVIIVDPGKIETDARELVADIFDRKFVVSSSRKPGADHLIDVLVAEDNEVNQIVFSQILEGFGYRYVIATDGAEAVRLWREHSPRIVLMDVTLPELNGFEASRRIRELEPAAERTPIIGVLPHPFDQDRENCFASGMDDVILKPMSPEMLEAVFAAHLNRDEKSAASADHR